MNDEMKDRLDRLDQIAPPPHQTLTIEEVADIFGMAPGSLRNIKSSDKKLPFPVLKIGGSIRVDKITLARYMAGLSDGAGEPMTKSKKRAGRPLNSIGLQRYAVMRFCEAVERIKQKEREEIESTIAGRSFPNYIRVRL